MKLKKTCNRHFSAYIIFIKIRTRINARTHMMNKLYRKILSERLKI